MKYFLLAGLLLGWIILIRPTGGVVVLYPLLYGVTSPDGLRHRFAFFIKNWPKVLLAAVPALLIWLPQLYYWHYISGDWVMYSYKKEGFDNWAAPKFAELFFSPLNGYFLYNPVMLLPVAGTFFLLKNNRFNAWAVLLVFWLSAYLFASWWCWWFGGAYGLRSFVDLLPLLAFPLCFVLGKIWGAGQVWLKMSGLALVALLCFYNFRMVLLYQGSWSEMDYDLVKYLKVLKAVFFLG